MGPKAYLAIVLALLLAGCQNLVPATTDATPLKTMHVDGADLSYVEAGQGETVVVVHGAVGDWRTYEGMRPQIAAKYHYVAYSRRYHHPNAWSDDGRCYNFDQHIEDLAAFIRGLNVGPVHLVGNSYAGRMVGVFALKYPQLLRSAVLGDSGLVAPAGAEGKAAVQAIRQDMAKAAAAALAGDDRQAAILVWDAVNTPHNFYQGSAELQQRWLDNAKTVRPMVQGAPAGPVSCEQLGTLRSRRLPSGQRGVAAVLARRHAKRADSECSPQME